MPRLHSVHLPDQRPFLLRSRMLWASVIAQQPLTPAVVTIVADILGTIP